jgi:hypothetical protein
MDTFNEYLKGKQFVLYTDHKPLEKMSHLHTKTMNRLQLALLEHDFVIQYKKGAIMPADNLSRLPSTKQDHLAEITTCFNPFQPELLDLQKADPDLQKMNHSKWLDWTWTVGQLFQQPENEKVTKAIEQLRQRISGKFDADTLIHELQQMTL